jgi:hypothetical protein
MMTGRPQFAHGDGLRHVLIAFMGDCFVGSVEQQRSQRRTILFEPRTIG